MTQVQHSQTKAWHRTDCPALTKPAHVECECPEFDFYDVNPFLEAGAGEGFYFRWRGTEYVVECWATSNSGGQDIYDVASGESADLPWNNEEDVDEINERFEEALVEFRGKWDAVWAKRITPALEAAKKELLGAAS